MTDTRSNVADDSNSCYTKCPEDEVKHLFKVIRLKGNHPAKNPDKDYKIAKTPSNSKWSSQAGLSRDEQAKWLDFDGWLGLAVPRGILILDIDNATVGECLYKWLIGRNLCIPTLRTPNGWQFFFANSTEMRQTQDRICGAGFKVDTRTETSSGYIVIPSRNTPGREWVVKPSQEQIQDPQKRLLDLAPPFIPLELADDDKQIIDRLISRGERHATLLHHAVRLYGLDRKRYQCLSDNTIGLAIQFINEAFCVPPKNDQTEIERLLADAKNYTATTHPVEERSEGRTTQANRLLNYVFEDIAETFLDQFGVAHFRTRNGKNIKTTSKAAELRLTKLFHERENSFISSDNLKTVIRLLEARTVDEGNQKEMYTRSAQRDEALYVELRPGRIVEITQEGWQIRTDTTIVFRQYSNLQALPEPIKSGIRALHSFLRLLPCRGHADMRLTLGYVVTGLLADISRPILMLTGTQGAGKTTSQRLIKRLLDPTEPEMIRFGDGKDATQKAAHCQVVMMDNTSQLKEENVDMLCRWVTGDSDSKRRHYSDDDDVIYKLKRLVLLNGINLPSGRADLIDRCLPIEIERIPDSMRMSEQELWSFFKEHHGEWLGAIFTLLSDAMRVKSTLKVHWRPRLADWGDWMTAVYAATECSTDQFREDWQLATQRQYQSVYDSSPLAQAVVTFMEGETRWEGTAAGLLEALTGNADAALKSDREWPKSAIALGQKLAFLTPALEGHGIEVKRGNRSKHKRLITLTKRTIRGDRR